MAKILYLSCHEVLEYDEVSLLLELGHEVFSPGAYVEPANPGGKTMRPSIPGVEIDPDLRAQYELISKAQIQRSIKTAPMDFYVVPSSFPRPTPISNKNNPAIPIRSANESKSIVSVIIIFSPMTSNLRGRGFTILPSTSGRTDLMPTHSSDPLQ